MSESPLPTEEQVELALLEPVPIENKYGDQTSVKKEVTAELKKNDGKRRLACSNCRKRRKKCDVEYPCGGCSRLGLECNINEEDLRKTRHSSSHVKTLEAHISNLEKDIQRMVSIFSSNASEFDHNLMPTDIIIKYFPLTKSSSTSMSNSSDVANIAKAKESISVGSSTTDITRTVKLEETDPILRSKSDTEIVEKTSLDQTYHNVRKKKALVKGSLYPEGPVSYKPKIKSTNLTISFLVSEKNSSANSPNIDIGTQEHHSNSSLFNGLSDSNSATVAMKELKKNRITDLKTMIIDRAMHQNLNLMKNDPSILKSLSNFYKWLYPGHFIFVHRESFLYGFFMEDNDDYGESYYCSKELVYAMCAIGSRLSKKLEHKSEYYYEQCKTSLLKAVFDEHSVAKITTVQALFCLAFYELGKGNNQLAWYFSGLAVRVGYDMGFQLDPEGWYSDDTSQPLTRSELEIRSRIYWGCYIADHFICLMLGRTSTLNVSNSTIPESDELPEVTGTEEFRFEGKHVLQISLPLKNLIVLSRIVEVYTSKIFIETEETDQKVQYLAIFNSQVANWRESLPSFLNWSKSSLNDIEVSTDPTLSHFWYYYYIVVLNFNKPFIEDCDAAKTVIMDIIDDLKTLFNNFYSMFHTFRKITLYQLNACLLAIKCLKKFQELAKEQVEFKTWDWDEELKFFSNIFYKEMSLAFDLPKRLEDDTNFEIEQEKLALTQVNNNSHTYDFSLSNEIDDYIKELFDVNEEFRDPNINFTVS
ncbi:hypothetical protein TPHA_0N00440 [Tetrapisispora phaffii CBS 4417]|uniref:Zn(2)-C6 fungal-type domain-containing protein n=1 Tax=Tetrapisispora phaffii (strain ATCC 24235 / CBS 4417 / NBRC 1672 / NRRL Y-8282 / UCD 70-5) TaxID=1071381 RepID=G8C0Z6_TETPH|nr:hypothetical protein TPHA_0N00440 [Tetrapisispora phaffii CBS 4417]CCE65824.1 hypothetical protein TPHA_0N00440 [Tetrapisispora phaffii CBS 4417]